MRLRAVLAESPSLGGVTAHAAALIIETSPDDDEIWTTENIEKVQMKHVPDFEGYLRECIYQMIVKEKHNPEDN